MFDEDYGVQSYFGESDSNFFGDTSNDMIFGEGYGQPVTNGQQFFSEAVGFSSDCGEFISEAATTGGYGEMFTECGDLYEESSNSTSSHFGDMAEADSKHRDDSEGKHLIDSEYKGKKSKVNGNSTHVTPENVENLRHGKTLIRNNPESIWKRDVFTTSKREYDAAKRHGREVGRRLDSNK